MELHDFIDQTLCQIIDGVIAAQVYAGNKAAYINPPDQLGSHGKERVLLEIPAQGSLRFELQYVEFDVAVEVSSGSQSEKKAGINVLSSVVDIGGSKKSSGSEQTTSRIKFRIPMALPHQKSSPKSRP